MNATGTTTGYGRLILNVLITLVAVVAVYWLYQYLYAPNDGQGVVILSGKNKADGTINNSSGKPLNPIPATAFPAIYEGGQFSVEFWIYVSNWSVKNGQNKHIFSLGGQSFDTIRVYLAPFKSDLRVRVHTKDGSAVSGSLSAGGALSESRFNDELPATERVKTFSENAMTFDSNLVQNEPICDIADLDLQRWLHVAVTVSNRTVDTYLDGKLARSCVLPSFYKVDQNYTASICDFGGFGGYISNVTVYDYSLSPDIVYHNYMKGPGAAYNSFIDWLKSFFVPDANV